MAAVDMFEHFLGSISEQQRERMKELIKRQRAELFAARSEDARLRLVQEFITRLRNDETE